MQKHLLLFLLPSVFPLCLMGQTMTVETVKGEKIQYRLTDIESVTFSEETPEEPQQAPRIGDFLYADGSWSTQLQSDLKPIGIVFHVGEASAYSDRLSYYYYKDGSTPMTEIHGYAVALHDATVVDGVNQTVWWSAWKNNDEGAGCSTNIEDFLGYTNTRSIVSKAASLGGLSDADDNFPAAYYTTVAYEQKCPAPENTSGWFLPSAYQFKYIFDRAYFDDDHSGRACLENSFKTLGEAQATPLLTDDAEYWTSTESVDSYGYSNWAYYFNFDARSVGPGFIANYRKNAGMRVRSMIVF